jgi:hypothetical protein
MFDVVTESAVYKLNHPSALWNGREDPIEEDGGRTRRIDARRRA